MEKEFVPYELAVKLKELGFKRTCLAEYIDGTFYLSTSLNSKKKVRTIASAPLWQQAFDWFRDKGYGSFVETWINGGVKKFRGRNNYAPLFITDVFDTYEEARKACLEKLIQILEEKK